MHTFNEWKNLIKDRLFKKEDIPQIIKRCPRCQELSLVFNKESGKIICSKCGFEQEIIK